MRRGRDRWSEPIGGSRRRRPVALIVAGGAVGMLLVAGVVGYLLALLVRALAAGGSPLLMALCLGGVTAALLAGGIALVRVLARRFADGSSSERALTLGGLVLLMALAPFLMIIVVAVLAVGG